MNNIVKTNNFLSLEEILNYINIGRGIPDENGNISSPIYTLEDIHDGTPEEECLCYGITDKLDLLFNVGYYKNKNQWWIVRIIDGLAKEFPVEDYNIVSYIKYNKIKHEHN